MIRNSQELRDEWEKLYYMQLWTKEAQDEGVTGYTLTRALDYIKELKKNIRIYNYRRAKK